MELCILTVRMPVRSHAARCRRQHLKLAGSEYLHHRLQEMTGRAKDSLVSFGERLSTRIFAAYLTRIGVPATQFDAWDLGLTTSDEFTNAEIDYDVSLPAVRDALVAHGADARTLPVVTGFLGRGKGTGTRRAL
jgi:aspartokinase